MITIALNIVLLAAAQEPPAQLTTAPASQSAVMTRLELRISPFVDMHYFVRTRIQTPDSMPSSMPALTELPEAVAAARALETELGGALGWGLVESTLARCASAEEAVKACEELPETFVDQAGKRVQVRAGAVRLARAYTRFEPDFAKVIWPEHQPFIERARAQLERKLIPKQTACFADIFARLEMDDPRLEIPVYLVAEAPAPGAFTHRRRRGGGVCFVGVGDLTEGLLDEMVLHESIHALDIATSGQRTGLEELRTELRQADLGPDSPFWRDVPHTLMFVQSAATVRRVLNPAHKDYGDVAGYYAKVPVAARIVRAAWGDYLAGHLTREKAIQQMVAEARAASD